MSYNSLKGYVLVLIATIIWSGNFVVARILSNSVPPVTLVVMRSLIAALILWPFVVRHLRGQAAVIRRHLGYIAITAFLGLTVCNTLVYVAAATSNTLNMSLIAISSPILTVAFARMFLRDTLTFRRIAGLTVATFGVIVLITEGRLSRLASLTYTQGDLWMLGQAASFALYSILVRKKPIDLQPLPFLSCLFILGLLFCLPWAVLEWPQTTRIEWSLSMAAAILYLGIGPSLLAYLCWNESVAIIGPSRAALVYYCLPLFGGIEALLILGEPIKVVHVLSGVFILSGVIFATKN